MFYIDKYLSKFEVKRDLERAAKIAGDLVLVAIYAQNSHEPITHAVRFQNIEVRLKAAAAAIPFNRVRSWHAAPRSVRIEAEAARSELVSFLDEIEAARTSPSSSEQKD